jgi:predicted nucleotidyltransferase
MEIYKLKWTRLQNEIFRYLCIRPGNSINQRGIAKALNVSPTAIAKSIKRLEEDEIIKVKKDNDSKRLSIEFNIENEKVINLKRIENLKMIYQSKLVKFLEDNFPGTTIILFGSYSRGEDIWSDESEKHSSDIDIAIIGTKEKEIELKKFNEILNRKIILNFYPSFNKIHKYLKNNILNGIILAGSVEL